MSVHVVRASLYAAAAAAAAARSTRRTERSQKSQFIRGFSLDCEESFRPTFNVSALISSVCCFVTLGWSSVQFKVVGAIVHHARDDRRDSNPTLQWNASNAFSTTQTVGGRASEVGQIPGVYNCRQCVVSDVRKPQERLACNNTDVWPSLSDFVWFQLCIYTTNAKQTVQVTLVEYIYDLNKLNYFHITAQQRL